MSHQSAKAPVYSYVLSHQHLGFAQWPDEDNVVAFDPASGDTHLITAKAAFVLQLFEKGPLTRDGLLSKIRGNGQFGARSENLDAELDGYLVSFWNLGLIRVSRR